MACIDMYKIKIERIDLETGEVEAEFWLRYVWGTKQGAERHLSDTGWDRLGSDLYAMRNGDATKMLQAAVMEV